MRSIRLAATALIPLSVLCAPLVAQDTWPGWRGPHGHGVAEGNPPESWGEDDNLRWKIEVPGKGLSCPVIWNDRIYLTTAVPTGTPEAEPEAEPEEEPRGRAGGRRGGRGFGRRAPLVEHEFVVIALNRADGKEVWRHSAHKQKPHQGTHPDGSFASPTPITDGEVLIASFGSFGIFAYDMEGKPLWNVDLGDMDIQGSFGEGCSPLLHEDLVLINWDHNGASFLVALDKQSGEEKWRQERKTGTTWTTPVLVRGQQGTQIVVGAAKTIAYDVKSGEEVWSFGATAEPPSEGADEGGGGRGRFGGRRGRGGGNAICSPVVHEGLVIFPVGGRAGSYHAVDASIAKGEFSEGEALAWNGASDVSGIPSPIVHDGILYSLKSGANLLSAYDAKTGEALYEGERISAFGNAYASPVIAGGRIYFSGREGTFAVLEAGKEFSLIAINELEDKFDSSPAVAGDELYLRGHKHLYCIASSND